MTKMITPEELSDVVHQLLTDPKKAGELEESDAYARFMTSIANAVCDACGGEVYHLATSSPDDGKQNWMVGINGNDSLPPDGGVWRDIDPSGDLWDSYVMPDTKSNTNTSVAPEPF